MKSQVANLVVRPAQFADCAAINAIYNYYVVHSTTTYQLTEETLGAREKWLVQRGARHPVVVAEMGGLIVGWGSLNAWRMREAYALTAENSVYVSVDRQRQGVGTAIMRELFRLGREAGIHTIVAVIDADQGGSIRMHRELGFVEAGRLRELGRKFDRWLDVVHMQIML